MSKKNKKDLAIIIVSYNTKKLLKDCIKSVVRNTKEISYEIIVVDNASTDGSVELIEGLKKEHPVKLIANKKNIGFGPANNMGIKNSSSRYILLLNSDTVVHDNVLGEMVSWMDENEGVGVTSCALKNTDGSLQGTGGYFPTLPKVFSWMFFLDNIPLLDILIKPFHPMHAQSPFYKGEWLFKKKELRDWVTGAFFLIRREVIKEVGLFDEDYFMYTEEVDFCWRVKKAGWKVWYLPKWNITHLGGASSTAEFPIISEFKGVKLFYEKNMANWKMILLKILLKSGVMIRIILYSIIKGKEARETYVKAFKTI
jgi:GT2 family glycosyltransferase